MTERQNDRKTESQKDRITESQKDRMTERDNKIFKLVENGLMTYRYTDTKPQALEILSIIGKI
jgi:hypothetical protein